MLYLSPQIWIEYNQESRWCREEERQRYSVQELPKPRWAKSSGIKGNPAGKTQKAPEKFLSMSLVYWACVFVQGADNCLEGCVFVLTGVLESMERDETKSLIERYGGKVTGNISRKTTYLVQGRDSGVSKLEKVKKVSECVFGCKKTTWEKWFYRKNGMN